MEARCARRLLVTHDRVNRDGFALTHEVLAQLLGGRRATVAVATSTRQGAGSIRSRIVRAESARLLG